MQLMEPVIQCHFPLPPLHLPVLLADLEAFAALEIVARCLELTGQYEYL
jgi:hypothetical protein